MKLFYGDRSDSGKRKDDASGSGLRRFLRAISRSSFQLAPFEPGTPGKLTWYFREAWIFSATEAMSPCSYVNRLLFGRWILGATALVPRRHPLARQDNSSSMPNSRGENASDCRRRWNSLAALIFTCSWIRVARALAAAMNEDGTSGSAVRAYLMNVSVRARWSWLTVSKRWNCRD